jgi:hypothetical protein
MVAILVHVLVDQSSATVGRLFSGSHPRRQQQPDRQASSIADLPTTLRSGMDKGIRPITMQYGPELFDPIWSQSRSLLRDFFCDCGRSDWYGVTV